MTISAFVIYDFDDYSNEQHCGCEPLVEYVCSDDGVTYENRCEFFCAQDKLARNGKIVIIRYDGRCDGDES